MTECEYIVKIVKIRLKYGKNRNILTGLSAKISQFVSNIPSITKSERKSVLSVRVFVWGCYWYLPSFYISTIKIISYSIPSPEGIFVLYYILHFYGNWVNNMIIAYKKSFHCQAFVKITIENFAK